MTTSERWWAGAASLLAIVALVLGHEVRGEHRVARVEAGRAVSLQTTVAALRQRSAAPAEVPKAALPAPPPAVPEEITEHYGPDEERDRARRVALARMRADPVTRAIFLAERKEIVRAFNPGLAERLRLSADEEDQLLELMADQELRRSERYVDREGSNIDFDLGEFETRRQVLDQELQMHLGASRFREFEHYRETRSAREHVNQFRLGLDKAEDLTPEVVERLIDAIASEHARMQAEAGQKPPQQGSFGVGFADGPGVTLNLTDEGSLYEARQQLEDQDERVEKSAGSVLSRSQQKAYAAFLQERREINLVRIEAMVREHGGRASRN